MRAFYAYGGYREMSILIVSPSYKKQFIFSEIDNKTSITTAY